MLLLVLSKETKPTHRCEDWFVQTEFPLQVIRRDVENARFNVITARGVH